MDNTIEDLKRRAKDYFDLAEEMDKPDDDRKELVDEGCKLLDRAASLEKIQNEKTKNDRDFEEDQKRDSRNFEESKKSSRWEIFAKVGTVAIAAIGIGVDIWARCKQSNDERRNLEDAFEYEKTGSFASIASRSVVNNSLRSKK